MTTITLHRDRRLADLPQAGDVPAKIAFVAAAASVPPITMLHLGATAEMEPAGWTVSDYVIGAPYGVPLYMMTAAGLTLGAVVLGHAVRSRSGGRVLRWLLSVWAFAVFATAVFPTNVRGTSETISSTIHLMAGAVVFALLPVAGWLLARLLGGRRDGAQRLLRWTSVVGGLLGAALILNRLPGAVGLPELMLPPGILQRTAGAVLIGLLAIAAVAVLRAPPAVGAAHQRSGTVATGR